MQGKSWNDKMRALLEKRKWDMKDWRRAVKQDQRVLENLINTDTTGLPQENLERLYESTKEAKLDKKMLCFDQPIMIAVWAHKGGTGKSTTVANVSYELSVMGYNVLVIDTDSQSDVSSVLYPKYLQEPDVNFFDAFSICDDFVVDGYVRSTDYNGLDIVPGSGKCEALEGSMCVMEERLRDRIWPKCLKRAREENYYDFILVDMDKTVGVMNKSILAQADYVLSPIEAASFSTKALIPIMAQIEEMREKGAKLKMLGVFFNKVDMRKKKSFAESAELVDRLGEGKVLQTYIKLDSNVESSQKEYLPLGYYNRSCTASKQTIELTKEILERIARDLGVV